MEFKEVQKLYDYEIFFENDAENKWCPFTNQRDIENEDWYDDEEGSTKCINTCITYRCMAWHIIPEYDENNSNDIGFCKLMHLKKSRDIIKSFYEGK